MNLFLKGNGSVSDYLRKLYGELESEIDSFADEKIVNCDVDEWTEYLTEKYRVEPISFYVDYATRSIQKTQIKRNNPILITKFLFPGMTCFLNVRRLLI